jgi:hypothetical protein
VKEEANGLPRNSVLLGFMHLFIVRRSVRLLTAPTEDQGKLYAVLTSLKAEGGSALTQAIKTAMVRRTEVQRQAN